MAEASLLRNEFENPPYGGWFFNSRAGSSSYNNISILSSAGLAFQPFRADGAHGPGTGSSLIVAGLNIVF